MNEGLPLRGALRRSCPHLPVFKARACDLRMAISLLEHANVGELDIRVLATGQGKSIVDR